MAILHITSDDLARLRFAYRPLVEIPFSYRVMINPEYQSPHRRWVEETQRALHDVELPYLDALVTQRGFIPDFLTPTPITNLVELEDDLNEVLATPDSVIRQQVQWLIDDVGESEMRRFYLAYPHEALQCLVEDMRLYWQRALAESWSRMISVLEGDILYHGRLLALEGVESLLPDLHPSITYRPGSIHLAPTFNPAPHCPCAVHLHGEGIQLVPIIFNIAGRTWKATPQWRPMIGYNARGVGSNRETRAAKPLERALGAARAAVLQMVATPASTGEIARTLGITSSGVSEHLKRLTQAGLVEPHRSGKRVYYQLTRRGEELIALFERIY